MRFQLSTICGTLTIDTAPVSTPVPGPHRGLTGAVKKLLGWLDEGMASFSVPIFALGCAVVCATWMINNIRI